MGRRYRCDIIVVTWNQLDYIKGCVESIFKHTDVRSRLIIVDNASREDTCAYLKSLNGNAVVDVKLIFNPENLGPGKARNIALREIEADYACFVDSDVTVTTGWLSNMIDVAEANSDIGMVNPSSNNFNQVPPGDMSLDEYAVSLEPYKDKYLEVGHCISFCLLIKAEVIERIGFLDEDYILALYEDTDYSMKATAAGYRCVIARGSYVWHHGHGSTGRVKKMQAIAEKNKERFYKKWGRPLRILWCSAFQVESEGFRDVVVDAIELARDGNFVYLFTLEQRPFSKNEIFRKLGLIEHANVHLRLYNGKNFKWFCLWKVLIKRKKRYDMIIADDNDIVSFMKRFKFLYKAQLLTTLDFNEILKAVHKLKFE